MISIFQRLPGTARCLAVVAAFLSAATAHAQTYKSPLKLEFLQPTGQASTTDSIDIYVRLTNTDTSQAFSFDGANGVAGMPASALPAMAWGINPVTQEDELFAFASYSAFSLTRGFLCTSNTFTGDACDSGPYTPSFAQSPFGTPGAAYHLNAGQSQDLLFVTFTPDQGAVPAGTYTLYDSVLRLRVNGFAADGQALTASIRLADTCTTVFRNDCTVPGQIFTRTVVTAVPEPTSALMLSLGLAGLIGLRRRQR